MVKRHAFTLVELMVAMSIIVIMLGMAVVSFRTLTGSRSVASASNVISAMLSRVRLEAVGKQQPRALMFYLDQGTGRVGMIILREIDKSTPLPTVATSIGAVCDRYLDLDTDSDPVLLPQGIGLETVIGNTTGNRYTGFNDICNYTTATYYDTANRIGGVISFDSAGRLMTTAPGIVWWNTSTTTPTALGSFLFASNPVPSSVVGSSLVYPTLAYCLFESEPYLTQPIGSRLDTTPFKDGFEDDYAYPATEANKEAWLDSNATPYIIGRYNGTAIKGE
jgi:prepilin-type N-terminal cleavage/methylation domain-containing protein